jgi:branched-chain amino acid transport system substrate-binding protein
MTTTSMFAKLAAVAAVAALALTACTPPAPVETPAPDRKDLEISIGTLLPSTGSLAQFGPAAQAAVDLAVDDINSAGVGVTISSESRDSSDATVEIATDSTTELLDAGVQAIIGPISDNVSRKVIEQIVSAGVLQISPGNVSTDFTRYADDDLYWRTAPACPLEGAALGRQIAADGVGTLAVIYQSAYCEPGLPEALTASFGRDGGETVVSEAFSGAAPDFTAAVAAIKAEKPDAVAILGTAGLTTLVPLLTAEGFEGTDLYFTGLSIADHSADFPSGSIEDATASMPGLDIESLDDFTDRLLEVNPALTDFSFAAESYDAVILIALAALAANDDTSEAIATKLQEVSGGSGKGDVASDFASAAQIILDGGVVDYDGPSGSIAFDDAGDPQGAVIGMWRYGADNTFTRID